VPDLRLFFAAWPEPSLRQAASARIAQLGPGGRPVPADDLHVTLAFLGAVPEARLAEVRAVAQGLAVPAHELHLERLEYWPAPRVLAAVPPRSCAATDRLNAALRERCARARLPCENREFVAHLTLIRGLTAAPARMANFEALVWPITAVTLVASRASAGGPRYRPLAMAVLPAPGDESTRSVP
jgi:RNA 2',3'-cyclic 3'-phosphodiesterase